MTNDLLAWYPTVNRLETADLDTIGSSVIQINYFNFFFSLIFVVALIYLISLFVKKITKNTPKKDDFLLKRLAISPSVNIDYVKINRKLYLIANNANSIELIDTIVDDKEILELLSEESNVKNQVSLNEKFDNVLKTILKKTDEIERLKD
jgi:flagellar biogenesis protein FliO